MASMAFPRRLSKAKRLDAEHAELSLYAYMRCGVYKESSFACRNCLEKSFLAL
jgi:hypothetical protein